MQDVSSSSLASLLMVLEHKVILVRHVFNSQILKYVLGDINPNTMENYKKGRNVEEEVTREKIPIEILPENFLWMHVKGGTKVSNVVDFAETAFKSGEHRCVVWSGSGGGVSKTISCAEIMKRNFDLHQVTRISCVKIEEYWEPLLSGLDEIVVTRSVPSIHILLQLDEIDQQILGYQKPKAPSKFWLEPPQPAKQERNRDNDYARKRFDKKTKAPKKEANVEASGEPGQSGETSKKPNNFRKRQNKTNEKKVPIKSETNQ